MKKIFVLLAMLVALAMPGYAQGINLGAPPLPDIVTAGFDAYQKTGSNAAVDIWLKGSPMETDLTTHLSYNSSFSKVEGVYGKYLGWEVVRVVTPSTSTRLVYLIVKYEKGPMWVVFHCYKPADQWIIPTLDMSTNPAKVLPPNLLGGE